MCIKLRYFVSCYLREELKTFALRIPITESIEKAVQKYLDCTDVKITHVREMEYNEYLE